MGQGSFSLSDGNISHSGGLDLPVSCRLTRHSKPKWCRVWTFKGGIATGGGAVYADVPLPVWIGE